MEGIKVRAALRQAVGLALLPLTQGPDEVLVGGQAVIEGVMMRSPHSFAVAVRRSNGSVAVTRGYLERPSEKHRWLRYPVLRGLGTLGQAMWLGIRALRYSARQAMEDASSAAHPRRSDTSQEAGLTVESKWDRWLMALNIALSVAFFVLFYKLLPLYLATRLGNHYPQLRNVFVFNLVDGVLRIALFLAFLALLAQARDIQRGFEYHGAEHKVVWAFEKKGRLDVATARACTRFHPRCGTSFLLVVMVIALLTYMFLPFHSFWLKLAGRILLLPVIAGVSYEFIRFAARAQGVIWRWASAPGLWLQRLTTREPDDSQLEVAVRALETAMDLERVRGGELVVA
jgi:uncharacterized protein YqhQ